MATKPKPRPAPAPVSENSASQNKINQFNKVIYGPERPGIQPHPPINSSGPPDETRHDIPFTDPENGNGYTPPPPTGNPETDKKLASADWASSFFTSLGLPADVTAKVNEIFTQYSDTNAASAAALGYIRGTPWYAQTYPGITEGIRKGLVSNEADYRNLLNQQSQVYKQYLGRDVTAGEFAANLTEGAPLSTIGGRLQGAALAGTYGNDWRYTLGAFDTAPTGTEVKALGEQAAGLDTPLGQQVKRRLDLANQRLASVFRGSLATPGLSLASGRLAAPGLGAGYDPSRPDIAA